MHNKKDLAGLVHPLLRWPSLILSPRGSRSLKIFKVKEIRNIYTTITQFGLALLRVGARDPPAAGCAKPTISLELLEKPTFWASWRPRRPQDGPPGAQDGLPTGLLAPKTASRRASWRARRLPTGLLAPQTASGRASWRPSRPLDELPDAPDGLRRAITCRQDHLPTSPPASQVSPGAKRAFDACTFLPLTPYCRDSVLDKTAARRT